MYSHGRSSSETQVVFLIPKLCVETCSKIMEKERCLVIFFIVLMCIVTVNSLKCFQCSSTSDKDCDILTTSNKTSSYYRPCPNNTTFCRKISQTIVAHERQIITRKCGWLTKYPDETKCIKYDTQFKIDRSCQCYEDGCNWSPSLTPKWKTTLFFVLLLSVITVEV